jgi:hypothetical protein
MTPLLSSGKTEVVVACSRYVIIRNGQKMLIEKLKADLQFAGIIMK